MGGGRRYPWRVSAHEMPLLNSVQGQEDLARLRRVAASRAAAFLKNLEEASVAAALDVWLKHVARRDITELQWTRLLKAIMRGRAPESREVLLLLTALMHAAGLDERPALAAAVDAGATVTEAAALLGMRQQSTSWRLKSYRRR